MLFVVLWSRFPIDSHIIGSLIKNSWLKRKITDALLIKQEGPSLNVQDQSVKIAQIMSLIENPTLFYKQLIV